MPLWYKNRAVRRLRAPYRQFVVDVAEGFEISKVSDVSAAAGGQFD